MDVTKERNDIRLTLLVAILLIPVSSGWIWFHGATTQDGPSHLAAAKIAGDWIRQSRTGELEGSVRSIYRLHFEPVPNWGGQALGMMLIPAVPIAFAEVAMNLAGIWLPAVALAWLFESLRHSPCCGPGPKSETAFLGLWITTMATNVLWTFGFTSFLLGTALAWTFLRTLRKYGESGGWRLWITLAALWCATFLCHLVAFAIAGIVAACLVAFTPGWPNARRAAIAAALAIALPLLLRYRMMTGESPLEPIWEHFRISEISKLANWARQLGWVDPVSLHSKTWHPLTGSSGLISFALQPGLWVLFALFAVVAESVRGVIAEIHEVAGCREHKNSEHGGWQLPRSLALLTAFFALATLGVLGPDSLGARQGHYLPQRFCLAALSIAPAVLVSTRRSVPRLALGCVALAWLLQSVSAIDFARRSHEMTEPIRHDRAEIRRGDRILALIDAEPWAFRANPRLHADSLLVTAAMDTVSWNLYEAAHPYFPLQFREIVKGSDPSTLEAFSLATGKNDPDGTEASVRAILLAMKGKADVLYVLMDHDAERRANVTKAIDRDPGWEMQFSGPRSVIFRNVETKVSR